MEAFKEGDMVWVKWKNLWWPSKVLGESSYPSDLELPKDYLAVVRYIGEDDVEVVCCAQNIHHYNSERKEDFLRRGIKTDNTKFKQLFAERVRIAEGLVDGDPDILSKVNLKRINSYIFASPSDSKSKRIKKEAKKLSDSNHDVVTKVMSKKKKGSPQVTRVITHPRFISDKDDHTVRILADSREPAAKEPSTFTEQYRCHQCDFATSRLNNLLSHNQTHSSSPKTAYIVPIPEEAVGSVLKYGKRNSSTSSSSKKRRVPKDKNQRNNTSGGAKRSLFNKTDKPNKASQGKAEMKKKKVPKYTKEKDHILQQQLLDDWNEEDFSEEEREVQRMQEMLRSKEDKSRNCEEDFAMLLESTKAPDIPDVPLIKASFCCTNESSSDEEYEGELSSPENDSVLPLDGKDYGSESVLSRNSTSDFIRDRSFSKVLTPSDIEAIDASNEPSPRTVSPEVGGSPKHVHSPRIVSPPSPQPPPISDCDKRFDSIMAVADTGHPDTEAPTSTIVPPALEPASTVRSPGTEVTVPPASPLRELAVASPVSAESVTHDSDLVAEEAILSRVVVQDAYKDVPNRPHVYANVPLSPVSSKDQLDSPDAGETSDLRESQIPDALSNPDETSANQGENMDCVVITINNLNELDQVDLESDGRPVGLESSSDKFGGERDLLATAVATSDLLETQVPVVTSTNNTLEVLDKPDSSGSVESGFVIIQLGGKAYKVELSALAQVINSGQT